MSEFYQVVKIDGKGFGCVATKDIKRGTLILREKAQLCYKSCEFGTSNSNWNKMILEGKCQDHSEFVTPAWIKSVEESFEQMSKNNQEEFLKLHNHFLEQDLTSGEKKTIYEGHFLRSLVSQVYESGHEQEKVMAIWGICMTNAFPHDDFETVPIHASRFNHSCSPNIMRNKAKMEKFL